MRGDSIHCRARLAGDCYHGDAAATERREKSVGDGWREDGTYDRTTDTIVCDPCYLRLHGIIAALPALAGGRENIPLAIELYRRRSRDV